jgi:dTDP-glucose 4,6-dehydratase
MTKKIAIVTGCASFIGINLTQKLLNAGWYVYGIDKLTYVANKDALVNLVNSFNTFKFIEEDITKINWLPECDVLFNLAAESDVDNGNADCYNFIQSNIDGVRNLLSIINNRIVIKADKPLFFHMSTDEVYGDTAEGIFDEESSINPSNPYSATKAAADLLIKSWARTHGLDYIIARPSNNYGPYQYPEKLIPLSVKRLSRDKKIKLHNQGNPVRTWTHVEDTCEAIMVLYSTAERNRIYNISSEFEQKNIDVVHKVINSYFMGRVNIQVPSYLEHIDVTYSRPGQDVRYAISCNPLRALGWTPKKEFDVEIVKLVKYFKERFIW